MKNNTRSIFLQYFSKQFKQFGNLRIAPLSLDKKYTYVSTETGDTVEITPKYDVCLNGIILCEYIRDRITKFAEGNTNKHIENLMTMVIPENFSDWRVDIDKFCLYACLEENYTMLKQLDNFDFVQDEDLHVLANIGRVIHLIMDTHAEETDNMNLIENFNQLVDLFKKHISPGGDGCVLLCDKYKNCDLFKN